MTWRFRPGERWLSLEMPTELGGGRREVQVHGEYTLAPAARAVPV